MAMPRDKIRQIFNGGFFYRFTRTSTILWGIEKGMQQEINNLDPLIPYFAAQMGKEAEPIRQLIQAADWRGLVHYLFELDR